MFKSISKFLTVRGVHFFATRFGSRRVKGLAFDEKFRNGEWKFSGDGAGELASLVQHRAARGDVLIMGCGGASILEELSPDNFASILGVDISAEAIRLASQHARGNVVFEQADMVGFRPAKAFDVILFSESLYYVPFFERRALLERLAGSLKPGGCLIVTVAQARRHAGMLAMIRRNFNIQQDRQFPGSTRHLLVFSARPRPERAGATQPAA